MFPVIQSDAAFAIMLQKSIECICFPGTVTVQQLLGFGGFVKLQVKIRTCLLSREFQHLQNQYFMLNAFL